MTLELIGTDLNSLGITTQSVISLKSSAFKVNSASISQQYIVNNSFILDLRATWHVYNDKSRFTDLWIASDDDVLYIRESVILIEGFGIIIVIVTTIEELK